MQSQITVHRQRCSFAFSARGFAKHLRRRKAFPIPAASEDTGQHALLLADVSTTEGIVTNRATTGRTPLMLGLLSHLQRTVTAGFFLPIGREPPPNSASKVDRHIELMVKACNLTDNPAHMFGISEAEARKLIAAGKQDELISKIYTAFAEYKEDKQVSLVPGPSLFMGDTRLDATLAAALSAPVILTMSVPPQMSATDCYNHLMVKRRAFEEFKATVIGVALNRVPRAKHATFTSQLRDLLKSDDMFFAGGLPEDPLLAKTRLDEIISHLGAQVVFGRQFMSDRECTETVVASQKVEELLDMLSEKQCSLPLVVTSADRMDIVLGLLAAQLFLKGPAVAGVLLTKAGRSTQDRRYSTEAISNIFQGLEEGSLYQGNLFPVFQVDAAMYEVLELVRDVKPSVPPSSQQKIEQSKALFEEYIDASHLLASLDTVTKQEAGRVTPQLFRYNIRAACLSNPQRIVLPESCDKRVLQAAAEVAQRGLAKIILLGKPGAVKAEANKLGLDISKCDIVDCTEEHERFNTYVDALVEARKKKGLSREAAVDTILGDSNTFGTLMVLCNDADGMVSGAVHSTAATIRPAMQVLRNDGLRVSSVFFMCLPDRVLVYGDCAVNPDPNSEELAQIAMVSADTATAFGVNARVAMLSYSTLDSGHGPNVEKVKDAVDLVKKQRPDIKVEGPIQYDAAIDPVVAAVKVKTSSEVAGKATVFIFPDLNTGNNTYKAVQQATGAIAMGPVMQGLLKPVNDLSRGCTVPDIINTVCVTSVQAMQVKGVGTLESEGAQSAGSQAQPQEGRDKAGQVSRRPVAATVGVL